jgi:hypothetical protein
LADAVVAVVAAVAAAWPALLRDLTMAMRSSIMLCTVSRDACGTWCTQQVSALLCWKCKHDDDDGHHAIPSRAAINQSASSHSVIQLAS